jgi:hypothetical protein
MLKKREALERAFIKEVNKTGNIIKPQSVLKYNNPMFDAVFVTFWVIRSC